MQQPCSLNKDMILFRLPSEGTILGRRMAGTMMFQISMIHVLGGKQKTWGIPPLGQMRGFQLRIIPSNPILPPKKHTPTHRDTRHGNSPQFLDRSPEVLIGPFWPPFFQSMRTCESNWKSSIASKACWVRYLMRCFSDIWWSTRICCVKVWSWGYVLPFSGWNSNWQWPHLNVAN